MISVDFAFGSTNLGPISVINAMRVFTEAVTCRKKKRSVSKDKRRAMINDLKDFEQVSRGEEVRNFHCVKNPNPSHILTEIRGREGSG